MHFDFKKLRVRQAVVRAYEGYARSRELNLREILRRNLEVEQRSDSELAERRQLETDALMSLQRLFSDLDPWVRRWAWHALAAWPCVALVTAGTSALSLLKMAEGWALDGHGFWQF